MNHYEILEVKKTASQGEIREAYKKLVKKYHPDLYQGDKIFAEKKTQAINVAYDILSNPKTRSQYDDEITPKPTYTDTTYNYTSPKYNSSKTYNDYYKNYSNYNNFSQSGNTYSNYHYSRTPNSNYNTSTSSKFDKIFKTSKQKTIVIISVLLLYFVTLIINIIEFSAYYNDNHNSSSETPIVSTPEPETREFDINDYYSDDKLYKIYKNYYKDSFSSFSDFKEAFSEYVYFYHYSK